MHGQAVGLLPCGDEIVAAVVDGKTTGAGFGREVAQQGQGAVLLVDPEQAEQAAGPLAGVEKTPIRGQVDVGPQRSP